MKCSSVIPPRYQYFSTQSASLLVPLHHLSTFHNKEEVETALRDWLPMQQSGLYGDGNFNTLPIAANQFCTVQTSRVMCFTCHPPSSSGISRHTAVMCNTRLMGNKVPTYDGLISQESIRSQVQRPPVLTRYLHKAEEWNNNRHSCSIDGENQTTRPSYKREIIILHGART